MARDGKKSPLSYKVIIRHFDNNKSKLFYNNIQKQYHCIFSIQEETIETIETVNYCFFLQSLASVVITWS